VSDVEPVVRRAEDADEESVFELLVDFATSFVPERRAFGRSFAELRADAGCLVLVAEVDRRVEGYLLAFVHGTFYANGPVAWIEEVTVRADGRRGGLGRALVAEAERWASEAGAVLVALATRRAEAFWQAVGYEPSATYLQKRLGASEGDS
jgi:GNAT superfamily N-acetyltransferase